MAAKARIGGLLLSNRTFGRPKKTRQGNGQHSKPSGTRKLRRGQGR